MATIALIVHDMRDDAELQARALAKWLSARGDKLAILESNVDELHLEDVVVAGGGRGLGLQDWAHLVAKS